MIISRTISGEARKIGTAFAELAMYTCSLTETMDDVLQTLNTESEIKVLSTIKAFKEGKNRTLVLFGGGETTVTVTGKGKGGRNQEMVLSFGISMTRWKSELKDHGFDIEFLSCGTDGIDGPTDAAGAVWNISSFDRAEDLMMDPTKYLENNDSYNFWSKAGGLVKTGHTGTNVMDIQVLKIIKRF